MEHHTTPEEPQVAVEELGAASPTTDSMQNSMYPQKADQQIPRPHSLPSTTLEPRVVVDGSAARLKRAAMGKHQWMAPMVFFALTGITTTFYKSSQ